ncbi:transcription elongation factor 1 [Chloropicon primus]|uniref:Transcription elongation factor 1 homolog n=1 Tax=Chloropicon primus TaxID=1764295 RepID=A0A5B8MZV1_9CHLO|nr:transcription elongation factor 1 [Chloropicon primus]UPR05230.1 transcription elongation factor 1 [Chloropicon primus]|mmetsp:Transcript_14413/g.40988  ORF Transcript_14413/g.40988 Transcript_14413/m.40988 type:complete len:87 (+) Transcript_14413:102-362(+)|eukprot:QDZ26029.1 transcription elongation factor 1 [Chloropicon primus]
MGKRKSSAPPPAKKKQPKVPTIFDCPFCQRKKSVTAELRHKTGTARIECRHCKAYYDCEINSLSEPIDVYSEWIDKCEQENEDYDE